MMKPVRLLCLLLLAACFTVPAKATHIVGGEVTYKCLGSNRYEIRIDIYQDCVDGDRDAITQDSPAVVAIFDGAGNRLLVDTGVRRSGPNLRVPANFNNSCVNNPPNTCLNKVSFIKQYTLPASSSGYYVVYERCCRNGSVVNIINPSNVGATYYAVIPPRGTGQLCNSSAVFKNYPPQIICVNEPLFYDHSATDADGDSLSYEFCAALRGGSSSDPRPVPSTTVFNSVVYNYRYSASAPMGGAPLIQIDAATGKITGTPDQLGRYVVAVCCHEWRNGVIINTVTREFQFVVTNCSRAVVANVPQLSDEFNTYIVQCKGFTVHFANTSTGANTAPGSAPYFWDFGVAGTNSDTATQREPVFTYPDTGIYEVKLIVNRGTTCSDSITRLVKIYPDLVADFDIAGLPCPDAPLQFGSRIESTYQPITVYAWSFGDGAFAAEPNPVHSYATGGQYQITLSAQNIKGCRDTASRLFDVVAFRPFAGNDTIIVRGEHVHFNAGGGDVYTWTPSIYLNNPAIRNPIGYYPDTTRLDYIVHIATESGCEGDDTVNVWVVAQSAIFVPSAFSPNGDGLNDVLRPIGIGYGYVNYFRVFNRWGQPVFYGTHFNDGWDGSYQGHAADIGTYFWELSVRDRFGEVQKLKGDATLIR